MRKDVRMGFGVGGVLLAVIIASVLIIHRNKSNNKAVAFDPGKTAVAPTNDATAPDATPKASDNTTDATGAQPIARVEPTTVTPAAQDAPKSPADDATDKTGARWDCLLYTSDAADE